jgi:hypothetical protein
MRNQNTSYALDWKNPQTKKTLVVKYLRPWRWEDVVGALLDAKDIFELVDHSVAIVHDQLDFPSEQSTIGAIRDLWGEMPPPPKNLRLCIVVAETKNNMLQIGFDIFEKVAFQKTITYFVDSMEEANKLLERYQLAD